MAGGAPIDYLALKARGMMKQRTGLFSVRLGVTGGHLPSAHLTVIADLAARYARGEVHLTTRQGIEIPNVPIENLEPLERDLAAAGLSLGLTGARVRGITACPGDICQCGLIDTQQLARAIDSSVGGRAGLPHKFKIGITGCPNGCTKPVENDLGIMGSTAGYRVFVGGRMGRTVRLADRLPFDVKSEEALLSVISAAIDWYCENGQPRERFGVTIERVGLASLVDCLKPLAG